MKWNHMNIALTHDPPGDRRDIGERRFAIDHFTDR
jgi:hypothetical protein